MAGRWVPAVRFSAKALRVGASRMSPASARPPAMTMTSGSSSAHMSASPTPSQWVSCS